MLRGRHQGKHQAKHNPSLVSFRENMQVRFIDPRHGFWRNGTFIKSIKSRKLGMLGIVIHPTLGKFKIPISDIQLEVN